MRLFRWIGRLTDKQFAALAVTLGLLATAGFGYGSAALISRFGDRALPLLAVVLIASAAGTAAMLSKLHELQNRSRR